MRDINIGKADHMVGSKCVSVNELRFIKCIYKIEHRLVKNMYS